MYVIIIYVYFFCAHVIMPGCIIIFGNKKKEAYQHLVCLLV